MTTPTTLPEALAEIEGLRGQVRELIHLLGQGAQPSAAGASLLPEKTTGAFEFSEGLVPKQAGKATAQYLLDLHQMIETIPDVIFKLDLQGNLAGWNKRLAIVTGFSPQELADRPALSFVPRHEHAQTAAAIRRAFEEGYAELEGHLLTKDGRTIPYYWTGARLHDPQGRVIGLTGVGRDITRWKVMAQQRQEQAERLRLAMDIAKLATWDWDISTNKVLWSENCEQVKRLPPGTLDGTFEAYQRLVHPDDLSMLFADINRALAGPDPYYTEHRIVPPGGEIQWIEGNGIVYRNESGQPVRMVGTVRNTTARRRAEEALRTSEARFRGMAEATTDWMWEIDAQGVYTYCSPKILDVLGYEPDETLGKTPFDFMPEEEARRVAALFQPIAAAQQPFSGIENVNRRKDGRLIVLECRGVPILDADGMLRGYRGFDQDITARKEAEQKLRESEERFATAFNEATIGMALVAPVGRWLEVNQALSQIVGYSKAELQSTTFQALTHPDDLPRTLLLLDRLVKGEIRTLQMEHRFLHKEGHAVWVFLNLSSVRDSEGQTLYQIAQIQDITERKRAEQLLELENQVLALMACAYPLPETLSFLCECCESLGHGMLASVLLLDQDSQQLRHCAAPSLPESYTRAIDGVVIGPKVGSCGTAAYLGHQVIVSDIASDPLWEGFRELALNNGLRACWSNPIISDDGHVRGTFALYYRTPREPVAADQHLIDRMTNLVRVAIERTRGQQALRMSEERLRQALLASNTGLWDWNTETGEMSFSKEWKNQLGFSEADLPDRFDTWETRLHPDDRLRAMAYIQSYLAHSEGEYRMEFRLRHKDDTYRWIEARASFITEPDGRRVRLLGSHIDITVRKRTEEALRESQERYACATAVAKVGVWELDPLQGLFNADDNLKSLFGYTRDELSTDPFVWLDLVYPDDRPISMEAWNQVSMGFVDAYSYEIRMRHKDGSIIWTQVRGHANRDETGRITRLIGATVDITERKRAEAELRRSHTFLRQVIDTTPNFIFAKDRDGRFTLVNKAVADAYGTTVDNLFGKTEADFNPNRDEVAFFAKKDLEVLDSSQERFIPEEKITDATGQIRWLQTVKRPLLDDTGRATMVLGASTDITARKGVEQALRRRESDLQAAMAERERISEDLHDGILQSIYAIGLGLEACKPLIANQPKRSAVKLKTELQRTIGQLNHVLEEVRNFIAGLESHILDGQEFDTVLRTMGHTLAASYSIPCRVMVEKAAAQQLSTEQAYHVMNVAREALSNSFRHSHARRITLSLRCLRCSVRLSVIDNGVGFNPSTVRDTGHGLANMASRASKIGGTFTLLSKPRGGTKVILDLPMRCTDAGD